MDRKKLENIIARAWENGRMQYNPSKGGTEIRQDYTDFRCSINYVIDELCEGTKSVETKASDISQNVIPRYFEVYTCSGGQRGVPFIIKGRSYTEAVCEYKIRNPYWMSRDVNLIGEVNEG